MKNRLSAFTSAGILGLCLLASGTTAAHAQSSVAALMRITEDTFVRVPALEFTVASVDLDHYLAGVPLDFSKTERALSQVRPGVNYNDGMVWLTFKIGGKRGLLSQIRNLRLMKRSKSTYHLASSPRYDFTQSVGPAIYSFDAERQAPQSVPAPKPRPAVRTSSSQVAMNQTSPEALTVDHRSPAR